MQATQGTCECGRSCAARAFLPPHGAVRSQVGAMRGAPRGPTGRHGVGCGYLALRLYVGRARADSPQRASSKLSLSVTWAEGQQCNLQWRPGLFTIAYLHLPKRGTGGDDRSRSYAVGRRSENSRTHGTAAKENFVGWAGLEDSQVTSLSRPVSTS